MIIKEQVNEAKEKLKGWFNEHQGEILYGCYIAVCIGSVAVPIIQKSRRNYIDFRRDRMIYDPSMGFYWETKRNLTNNQKLMIEARHRNGEAYGEILKDMKLLRR